MKHKDFYLKRIYNSSNDGRYLKNLYEKCDKKQLILLVFESEEGYKFGGFIQEFVVLEPYDYDITEHNYNNEDFIFSLDNMKIYNAVYNYDIHRPHGHLRIFKDMFYFEYAICCSESKGKSFLVVHPQVGLQQMNIGEGLKNLFLGILTIKELKL